MKYAVIALSGKQYQVSEGQELIVDQLPGEAGGQVDLKQVLLLVDDHQKMVGRPNLEKTEVKAKIVEHLLGKKIRVATYKSKARYRKVKGHRSKLTKILIEKIVGN